MIKLGVIGLGSIGLRHARNALVAGADVLGFDPDAHRGDLLGQAGGIFASTEDAIFETCDAVVVCSPNSFHFDHMSRAIDAGLHALVEKPLSHKVEGLTDVLDKADEKGLIVGAAMNLRFHPVSLAAKRILRSGVCGTPIWARLTMSSYLPDWRPHQDYRQGYTADQTTGGVLFDIVHEPDLAAFLLGSFTVVAASAVRTGLLDIPSEDCADLILDHAGVRSTVHVDYISTQKRRFFEIQCSRGFIHGDLNLRKFMAYDKEGVIVNEELFPGAYDHDYVEEMKAFLSAVSGKGTYPCPARDALDVLTGVIQARRMAGLAGA